MTWSAEKAAQDFLNDDAFDGVAVLLVERLPAIASHLQRAKDEGAREMKDRAMAECDRQYRNALAWMEELKLEGRPIHSAYGENVAAREIEERIEALALAPEKPEPGEKP